VNTRYGFLLACRRRRATSEKLKQSTRLKGFDGRLTVDFPTIHAVPSNR
jgi:hypothetical protein